jgi:hypothetical protein
VLDGEDDPYHSTMSEWGPAHGHQYFSLPGDHLAAFYLNAAETAARVAEFLRARDQM